MSASNKRRQARLPLQVAYATQKTNQVNADHANIMERRNEVIDLITSAETKHGTKRKGPVSLTPFGECTTYRHYSIADNKCVSDWRNTETRDRVGITLESEKVKRGDASLTLSEQRERSINRAAAYNIEYNLTH